MSLIDTAFEISQDEEVMQISDPFKRALQKGQSRNLVIERETTPKISRQKTSKQLAVKPVIFNKMSF